MAAASIKRLEGRILMVELINLQVRLIAKR